jgi:hypothetical protein
MRDDDEDGSDGDAERAAESAWHRELEKAREKEQ